MSQLGLYKTVTIYSYQCVFQDKGDYESKTELFRSDMLTVLKEEVENTCDGVYVALAASATRRWVR
jgi:hypothetical protein